MLNTFHPNSLLKLNNDGDVIFYKYDADKEFSDFKRIETKDGIRYIYNERYESHHSLSGVMYTPVEYVIMDDVYRELSRLRMKRSDKIPFDEFPADSHDIIYIDDSHYILMTYMGKRINNLSSSMGGTSSKVVACIIQEIKNGEVVFEWDSTDYPELYEYTEVTDFANLENIFNDYAHMNSLEIDLDGNFLCSFRNLSAILKINSKTGDIIWRLGGDYDEFGLLKEQLPSCQHYARRNQDGSISVFDNGNRMNQSRILKFWIDEENKKLLNWEEFVPGPYFSFATGSAQKISDTEDIFVVGWGIRSNKNFPSLSEINFSTSEVNFELFFNEGTDTYRGIKY